MGRTISSIVVGALLVACAGEVPAATQIEESSQDEQDGLGDTQQTKINPEAFWENDPPPMQCLPEGTQSEPPEVPGGTPECPDDKNREGCPCPAEMVGKQVSCWPGLRVNRDRGICTDGVTTCETIAEFTHRWGPCEGAVLPVEGATSGPASCGCFSRGTWDIENVSPCIVRTSSGQYEAVSTYMGSSGASCPSNVSVVQPEPGQDFSKNSLSVDCAGQFKLCFTIKAGDAADPSDADCTLAQTCTEAWYDGGGTAQELPPLPSWTGSSSACAKTFNDLGGYAEMSVVGLSLECQEVGTAESPYVFNRISYCPAICNQDPDVEGCRGCTNGSSGTF